ncbi:hypothetical protein ACHAXH_008543 [Discostella pseudostelligera]
MTKKKKSKSAAAAAAAQAAILQGDFPHDAFDTALRRYANPAAVAGGRPRPSGALRACMEAIY